MALHQALCEYAAYLVKKDSGGTKASDGGIYYSNLKELIAWACGQDNVIAPYYIKRTKNLNVTAGFNSEERAQQFKAWIGCGIAYEESNQFDGPYGMWRVDMFDLLQRLEEGKEATAL